MYSLSAEIQQISLLYEKSGLSCHLFYAWVYISEFSHKRKAFTVKNQGVADLTDIILPLLKAFFVGGLICTVGQLLIDFTKMTPAKILVSFVIIGVVLGGLGIYEPLVKWAGSGATLPLTGFGYALAKGTKEAVAEDGLLGALSGPLASSSVGIMAAVISGLIASVFARSKDK